MHGEQSISISSSSPDTEKKDPEKEKRRCTYCGSEAPLVWVHGHGQCVHCGINVEECCRGERCGPE
ncbi:hypothetical protein [Fodinibius sp.]|uniref:hypothetical protein n=1 Tax=Fodinibius sp. TaxID=1872440 RepID=UPI0035652C87